MCTPVSYLLKHGILQVDASNIYGEDRNSQNNLRSFKDGKLKVQVLGICLYISVLRSLIQLIFQIKMCLVIFKDHK